MTPKHPKNGHSDFPDDYDEITEIDNRPAKIILNQLHIDVAEMKPRVELLVSNLESGLKTIKESIQTDARGITESVQKIVNSVGELRSFMDLLEARTVEHQLRLERLERISNLPPTIPPAV